MAKSPEELLKRRIKLIADWPGCQWPIGTIWPENFDKDWDKYPHLFKRLEWYEDREESEMPAYVKVIKDGSFVRIDGDIYDEDAKEVQVIFPKVDTILKVSDGYKWDLLEIAAHLISKEDEWVEVHALLLMPATEDEYNSYLSSLNK